MMRSWARIFVLVVMSVLEGSPHVYGETPADCDAFLGSANRASRLTEYYPDEQILYRGLRIRGEVQISELFSIGRQSIPVFLPKDPFKLRDVIIRHKDGLRSQGDGIISTSTQLKIATLFSDTSGGDRGFILKIRTPPNAVSVSQFSAGALNQPWDHGVLHGFEYESEVIIPEFIPFGFVLEVLEVVHSGSPESIQPPIVHSWNYPFAVERWTLGDNGSMVSERIDPPLKLPIFRGEIDPE